MDLPVIAVTEDEATTKLAEYQATDPATRTGFDVAMLRAYRAVRGGAKVIRLSDAIRAGGFDTRGLPRLAVASTGWDQVTCWWASPGDVIFADDAMRQNRGAAVGHHSVRVRAVRPTVIGSYRHAGLAVVPPVPPACRPRRGRLSRCHVLWEAEWDLTVPRDPALIRRVAGDLWVVLFMWDLTELERAVLAGR
jgi:hypothetical protein